MVIIDGALILNFNGGFLNMRKKIIVLLLLIAGGSYIIYYNNQYSIVDEKASIEAALTEWLNRVPGETYKPTVIQFNHLAETTSHVVLYTHDTGGHFVGYAQLIKGWNGKFKIHQSGEGNNIVSYNFVNTDNGRYGIIIGSNPEFQIDRISASAYEEDFTMTEDVPKKETFIIYRRLPDKLKQPLLPYLTLLDKNEKEITSLWK